MQCNEKAILCSPACCVVRVAGTSEASLLFSRAWIYPWSVLPSSNYYVGIIRLAASGFQLPGKAVAASRRRVERIGHIGVGHDSFWLRQGAQATPHWPCATFRASTTASRLGASEWLPHSIIRCLQMMPCMPHEHDRCCCCLLVATGRGRVLSWKLWGPRVSPTLRVYLAPSIFLIVTC